MKIYPSEKRLMEALKDLSPEEYKALIVISLRAITNAETTLSVAKERLRKLEEEFGLWGMRPKQE